MYELDDRPDGVTVVRMTHGKANTLDPDFADSLTALLARLEGEPGCRAVVLTGAGRIFSAGVDLRRAVEGGPAYLKVFLPTLSAVLDRLFFFAKPAVAAVNGHAIAGGCIFACACDHRVMARGGGRIGVPELLVGVPFPVVPLQIMRFALTTRDLQEVVWSGRTLLADQALAAGLVDAVVEPEALLEHAVQRAAAMAAMPARSFALTKAQMRWPVREQIDRLRSLDAEVAAAWQSDEVLAAMRAYVAKTLG